MTKVNEWDNGYVSMSDKGDRMGPYTSVIGPQEGQENTFSKVMEPMLKSFNDGYNCTAFVYG